MVVPQTNENRLPVPGIPGEIAFDFDELPVKRLLVGKAKREFNAVHAKQIKDSGFDAITVKKEALPGAEEGKMPDW
jgi:hypothetical protein